MELTLCWCMWSDLNGDAFAWLVCWCVGVLLQGGVSPRALQRIALFLPGSIAAQLPEQSTACRHPQLLLRCWGVGAQLAAVTG